MTGDLPRAPLLILCSPRSCSSVTCAMLGQHPQLYGFPELNLFVVDTVEELCRLGNGEGPAATSYVTGLLRAVAELEFGGQTDETIQQASEWLSSRAHWKTWQMFNHLLARVHPRIGVDKSPRTGLSPHSLDRALSDRPGVRAIHLTRHPVATLQSLHDNHVRSAPKLASSASSVWLFSFYARIWVQSQEMILRNVQRLGSLRALQLRAEDLLFQPDIHLAGLARWLNIDSGLESIAAMKHPERSPYARPAPLGLEGDGDLNFLRSPMLRSWAPPAATLLPNQWQLAAELATKIDRLSRSLGYGPIC